MAAQYAKAKRRRWLSVALLLTGAAGLSGQSHNSPQSESQLRAAFIQTLEQQDLEGGVALYEPDAVFLSPQGRFADRAAIRTLYRSVFQAFRGQITMTGKHLITSGNLAIDDGSYSETITEQASGKKTAITGEYVLVARQQPDSSWRIAEIVWTQTTATPL